MRQVPRWLSLTRFHSNRSMTAIASILTSTEAISLSEYGPATTAYNGCWFLTAKGDLDESKRWQVGFPRLRGTLRGPVAGGFRRLEQRTCGDEAAKVKHGHVHQQLQRAQN